MKFDLTKIDKSFPMPSYREGQKEAIEFVLKSFNSGKRIVILECPTGGGKSPIGMTIANMVGTSYYLTITKILQDQLVNDFGHSIVELKGRNAYPCTFYKREGQKMVNRRLWTTDQLEVTMAKYHTCEAGYCRTHWNGSKHSCTKCFHIDGQADYGTPKGDLDRLPLGMHYSACPYYEQVFSAINSRKVVMNFSSFLFQTTMTKRFDTQRDLLILDESHNLEPQLLDFVSFSITDIHLQKHGIFIPELNSPYNYYIWMRDTHVAQYLKDAIEKAKKAEDVHLVDELSRVLKKYQLFVHRIEDADSNADTEWVSEYTEKLNNAGIILYRSVTIKPVFVHGFAEELLFQHAKHILMMSATILDVNVVCKSLGLKKSEVASKRMSNRFPVENRPIYLNTVAKMTGGKDSMHKWAPKLAEGVNKIMLTHAGEKGIIHTHNFAIMEYLLTRCTPEHKSRFLNQRDFATKTKMLEEHARRADSVIVAPAMHEGIDLVDSLSRFQILCKVPYANCFDNKQLARRVEIDRRYYTWLTALKLVQSYGRSIRSETDYAITYILDESIYKFLQDAKTMLPDWFIEAIQNP